MKPLLKKQTNCGNCGYYDGTYCRLGLGWEKLESPIGYCRCIKRLDGPRCGKCIHFSLEKDDRFSGHCDLHGDFRNFHDSCYSNPGYVEVPGKDLRPEPDTPPKYFSNE